MKTAPHIRIVCLKNQKSPYKQHHQSSFIVPPLQTQEKNTIQTPTLAFLSSRLQQQGNRTTAQQIISNQEHGKSSNSLESIQKTENTQLPMLEKYVQGQQQITQNKKSTIRHLMGSIDFSTDRRRQRKICNNIKKTIRNSNYQDLQSISQTDNLINRKKIRQTKKYNMVGNRNFLAEDLNNFITKQKQQELDKEKSRNFEEEERNKLKRLCLVNPESQTGQNKLKGSALNLYRFQNSSVSPDGKASKQTISNVSSLKESSGRSRLQQKILRIQLKMQEVSNFEWSRFEQKNPPNKNFSFRTLDS